MDQRAMGLFIILAGAAVIVVGVLVMFGAFGWFGRLPGDIRVERENVRVYVPLVSMLVISAVLSLLLYLFRR